MGVADWGDVPTWIGATGALGAAWFAYQTITSQRQQIGEQQAFIAEQSRFMDEQRQNLELERAELRAVAEDRRWAQARQIRMKHDEAGGITDSEGNQLGPDHWVVNVTNASDAPVGGLDVHFGSAYRAARVYEQPPGVRGVWGDNGEPRPRPLHLLGPGRTARFLSQRGTSAMVHNNRPTLFFTDNDDVRWSLDSYGKLEEVPGDD
jgi:hypothetical protein